MTTTILQLQADAKLSRQRVLAIDPKAPDAMERLVAEMANNTYPLIEAVLGAIQDEVVGELAELGDAVDELIDRADSILRPEVAAQILGALEMGKLLTLEVDKVLTQVDDVSRRKIAQMVVLYHRQCQVAIDVIANITVEFDPEDLGGDAIEDDEDPVDVEETEADSEETEADSEAAEE